jgi:hypothetical protein
MKASLRIETSTETAVSERCPVLRKLLAPNSIAVIGASVDLHFKDSDNEWQAKIKL